MKNQCKKPIRIGIFYFVKFLIFNLIYNIFNVDKNTCLKYFA